MAVLITGAPLLLFPMDASAARSVLFMGKDSGEHIVYGQDQYGERIIYGHDQYGEHIVYGHDQYGGHDREERSCIFDSVTSTIFMTSAAARNTHNIDIRRRQGLEVFFSPLGVYAPSFLYVDVGLCFAWAYFTMRR